MILQHKKRKLIQFITLEIFNIKYDFEACLNFEKRRLNPDSTGTGIRRANSDNDCDLDIQEY